MTILKTLLCNSKIIFARHRIKFGTLSSSDKRVYFFQGLDKSLGASLFKLMDVCNYSIETYLNINAVIPK